MLRPVGEGSLKVRAENEAACTGARVLEPPRAVEFDECEFDEELCEVEIEECEGLEENELP